MQRLVLCSGVLLAFALSACAHRAANVEPTRVCATSERARAHSLSAPLDAGVTEPAAPRAIEREARTCADPWHFVGRIEPDPISPSFWQPPRGAAIAPCTSASAEHREARRLYHALNEAIDRAEAGSDVAPLRAQLSALLEHQCFALAAFSSELPSASSTEALRSWWHGGGDAWALGFLERSRDPSIHGRPGAERVWFMPTERQSIAFEEHRSAPIAPLLCPARDEQCGRETSTFTLRAERLLRAHDQGESVRQMEIERDDERRQHESWDDYCTRVARSKPELERFVWWQGCASTHMREARSALPVGRFRAPTGWLVVEGRYERSEYCDTIRAFHLVSGSVYEARACAAWMARARGQDAGAEGIVLRSGRASPEALRDATLALIVAPFVTREARESVELSVPAGVRIAASSNANVGFAGIRGWGSSEQTELHWSWVAGGCERAKGSVVMPGSDDPGDDVAAHLLTVADESFDERDAPSAEMPRWIVHEWPNAAERDLRAALRRRLRERFGRE